ncbi:GntR family transcriptional regulator [Puteibacter caeruleilacunae]|nr:GntR family transcriptional regulator [Puteibacter caeruleilacunae]
MSEFIFKIDESSNQTKVQQLIHAISEAIATGILKEGDFLPSVNKLSKDSGVSRDTIFKAYTKLKQRSLVASTPTKGYYVANEKYNVFMLLDDFSSFKEQLYKSFRKNLPDSYTVDLMFHHYNREVFDQLIQNNLGKYSMYIVMNLDNKKLRDTVKMIDPDKLLILDMGKPVSEDISYLTQEFNQAAYNCLDEAKEELLKYDEFILAYPEKIPHPKDIFKAFKRFCNENDIKGQIIEEVEDVELRKGQAFWLIKDSQLVNVVRRSRESQLELGKDIGVLSYNDTPMKEVIDKGISVISSDFDLMGKLAAQFVTKKKKVRTVIDTNYISRGSL